MSQGSSPVPPRFVVKALLALRRSLSETLRAIVPPSLTLAELSTSIIKSQMIHVAAKHRLADHLAAGPRSAGELAAQLGLHEDSLRRMLRALVSCGVFARDRDGRFRNNRVSDALRTDVDPDAAAFAEYFGAPYHARAWAELEHTIRTGRSAFEHVHGQTFWEHAALHPEDGRVFAGAMSNTSTLVGPAVAEAYPFEEVSVVCDIAGGSGTLLTIFLRRHPHLRGILYDDSYVIDAAGALLARRGVGDRVERIAGSFFERVPSGADAYVMKDILHDWDDARSSAILRACRRAMAIGSRLLLVETIVEEDSREDVETLMDMQMMTVCSEGRQRSVAELTALLEGADFRVARVLPTAALVSIVDARAV